MKWKCNTFDCQHEFEDKHTEIEIEKENFKLPICPKCKDEHNLSYRND